MKLFNLIVIPLGDFLCVMNWSCIIGSSHIILQDHVEGYLELSAKTKIYFATAVSMWDADFYVKVDDDVHVNIGKWKCNLDCMPTFVYA